ncbi:MAG: proton-conducting transporter membrane subunit [Candidatus Thiothrix putei]|uniref:Proton-conducting transporter membrane subunit n=1 Tax=Candidatus Thiothrix putei TaxID=3080811 RepID=A0AA95HED2_9GAMM|nr:MAG: proton-conducting transporter membrane subunit [Candidatus Thiothrix putei]
MANGWLLLIPGLPLLAAVLVALNRVLRWNRCEASERLSSQLVLGAGLLSLVLVLWADVQYLLHGSQHVMVLPWLHSGVYNASISFMLDGLSLSMSTLVAVITLLVTRFSVNYLHRDCGFQRFFMVLALFTAAMQLIALSGSAVLAFVGWELAGASSYLLIAYNWQSKTATINATRAFVTNRLGDAGFLLGIFMAFSLFRSTEWNVMLVPQADQSSLLIGVAAFGLMGAALVKSAQFPFSAWITRALEGPTPSSTVFYGSLMVHAGIFLLLRIHPLLEQAPALQYLLLGVGVLTVLYGWLGGLAQTDIKTSLLFSTLAQTGLMLIAIALGWYSLALVHLVLHAVWRAYQFLHSPSFALHTQWQAAPAVPAWLGKRRWLHNAALQRFWLDPLADWLLVKPTVALSQEAQIFDGQILDKLSGTPGHHSGIATLADMQAMQQGRLRVESSIGTGSGLFGKLMQWIAERLEWFEQRLLLQQGGGKAKSIRDTLGRYLDKIERLLTQPRYLVLLILATLVVIFQG